MKKKKRHRELISTLQRNLDQGSGVSEKPHK